MLVRSGMTENQIAKSRQRLEQFLLDLLEPIGRSERRHWGELYVRGLLQDGERKSIEPMAARLPDGNVQAMQQFVGQSPWEWQDVWARLGKRMTAELEPDSAWVVDDTGFPKQGEDSVGVDRQYSGTLGKTGNCQVAVSLHHGGGQGNGGLGGGLYLPESWTKDKERCQAAGVPEDIVFKKKWELALDLIDQVRGWGVPDRIVLADAGYGEATEFRDGLEERGLRSAVGIAPQVGVWTKAPKIKVPEYSGRGAPPKKWDYGDQRPSSVKDVALKAKGWKKIRWRWSGWSRMWKAGPGLLHDAADSGLTSPMATFSAHTASPPPPSRTPAGSRASSRHASIAPRTTSARGPLAWAAPRTRTHRSIPAPPTPAGASRLPRAIPYPTPA